MRYFMGIESEPVLMNELYQQAADLGNCVAQYNLANMYFHGKGINKDMEQASYWYKKSAKQGFDKAQNKLRNF